MVRLHANDIDTDGALVDEAAAAVTMRALLSLFEDDPVVAVVLSVFLKSGSSSILCTKKARCTFHMIQAIGIEASWAVAVRLGFFHRLETPIVPELRLDLNSLTPGHCISLFRFDHSQIQMLVTKLRLPDIIIVPTHQDRVHAVEGVCLVLRRLSYPNRWIDLQSQFGRYPSALSRIFSYMLHLILLRVKRSVLSHPLSRERLDDYANAFNQRGAPEALRVFGTIDTKKHQICKPTQSQRSVYSGHKRIHCVKYQTLEGPDGLIIHCAQSMDGHGGDGYILRKSGLIPYLRNNATFAGFVSLGDSAYPNNDVMVSIFKGRRVNGEIILPLPAQLFNAAMSPLHTSVEWGYKKIIKYWAFIDFKKQMKIQKSRIEVMWHTAVFLTNALTCAKGGNQISKYFDLPPPSMEHFLDTTML